MIQNALPHPPCGIRVVMGDVGADVMQVCNRRIGPDYLVVHALAQDSNNCSACW